MSKKERSYSYGRQSLDETDIQAVMSVFNSERLTQGPILGKFENRLRETLDSKEAVVVSNGTAALHLTGLALKWGPEDVILTSPLSFVASSNCILYSGAQPDFVDIDPLLYTLDPDKLEEKIKKYLQERKKVKAVIAVDFAGNSCPWSELRKLADQYNFHLINDACHALGTQYKGDPGYGTKYADFAIYSFHPVKAITSGEGGAVLTNHSDLADSIRMLRTHGITKDPSRMNENHGPWYYEMQELGFNYRLTEFQAALGISQLSRLDTFIDRRREIADYYLQNLQDIDFITLPTEGDHCRHSYHLFPLLIDFESIEINRKQLFSRLWEKGLYLQVHYIPIHTQPYYRKNFGFDWGDFPQAEDFYRRELSLPVYPSLTEDDLEYITRVLKEILE